MAGNFNCLEKTKKKAELKPTQKIKPMKDVMKDVNCFVKNILYPLKCQRSGDCFDERLGRSRDVINLEIFWMMEIIGFSYNEELYWSWRVLFYLSSPITLSSFFVIPQVIQVKSMANSHTTYTLLYYNVTFFDNAISFVTQYILKYVTGQEKFKKRHTLEHSVILNYNSWAQSK